MIEILSKHGYKLTKQRLEVLNILKKSKKLVSAQEIHKKAKVADRASVYRTLKLFIELGLANVEVVNQENLYCLADHPHHHIICRNCGYIEEFPCSHIEFNKDFKNFINIEHHLTLMGLCSKCSK
jgi:Fe2+ or Zn2+ uptake regulation protein